ncbi:MAG: DUF72 domain-containing protein [Gammaproteobacteria bacterium]|nr:DUF72 domain-containing protein [Gammaproteobacteria bacterium]MDJ0890700.1 DUF72 domain-containing protein [Gammaproteobacteria bacterium]
MTEKAAGSIAAGTSGWHYPHWKNRLYPRDLPPTAWLSFYAEHFPAVEVNNSFYRLPEAATIEEWVTNVPESFLFAVKAPRGITHLKKLRNCAASLDQFLERLELFGPRLGPVLFQLPPHWHANPQRLGEFLELLPIGRRYVFEFRDHSWHTDDVYDLLADHNAAFCIYDLETFTSPLKTTADFVYVRLHGPGEQAYTGSYGNATLRTWTGRAKRWASREKRDVYVFLDNDERGYAVKNALRMRSQLGEA